MNLVPVFSHPQSTLMAAPRSGAVMATVTAEYRYGGDDGDTAIVMVDIENDYPDALDQARATAIRGLCELTGINTPTRIDETD